MIILTIWINNQYENFKVTSSSVSSIISSLTNFLFHHIFATNQLTKMVINDTQYVIFYWKENKNWIEC